MLRHTVIYIRDIIFYATMLHKKSSSRAFKITLNKNFKKFQNFWINVNDVERFEGVTASGIFHS